MDEQDNNLVDMPEEIDADNEGKVKKDDQFEFIRETIKDKPINKKRVLARILLTIFLAVVFGVVAGFTFVLTQPCIEAMMNPIEPQMVEIEQEAEAEEANTEEATLEEKTAEEKAVEKALLEAEKEQPEQVVTQIVEKVEKVDLEIDDYRILSEKLYNVAKEASRSVVTVTGLSSDVDWFMNSYEYENKTSGLIVADNGKELLILANKSVIESAKSRQITFCDGTESEGTIKKYDQNTGLAIVAVELETIGEETKQAIVPASFGNTRPNTIVGMPIIAIGNPLGYAESIAMGYATSNSYVLDMIDTNLQMITTDIYGSKAGNGVLVDLDGKVMGVICQESLGTDDNNLIKAYAISDLITTIEKLSNGQDIAYLGVKGTEVTETVNINQNVPFGAYVTEVIVDSPAMQEGIQSGDIIVKMGTMDIKSFEDYKQAMMKSQPGDLMMITVKRLGKGEYVELSYEITLGTLE